MQERHTADGGPAVRRAAEAPAGYTAGTTEARPTAAVTFQAGRAGRRAEAI